MAHFAKLNSDNIVTKVEVVSNDIATNEKARKTYSIKNRKFCDWKVTQISKIIQVKRIITIAKVFQDEQALYFPHQLDFRGRIYAIPMFLHP